MTSCQGIRLPVHRWASVKHLVLNADAAWGGPQASPCRATHQHLCSANLHAFGAGLLQHPAAAEAQCCLGTALTCLKLPAPPACMSTLRPDCKGWHCFMHLPCRRHLVAAAGSCPTAASPPPSGSSTPWRTAACWQSRQALHVASYRERPWHTTAARAGLTGALLCAAHSLLKT